MVHGLMRSKLFYSNQTRVLSWDLLLLKLIICIPGNCSYPAAPASESSMSRLIAEKGWLDLGHDLGISTFVFRLGGIYGPRRRFVTYLQGSILSFLFH